MSAACNPVRLANFFPLASLLEGGLRSIAAMGRTSA